MEGLVDIKLAVTEVIVRLEISGVEVGGARVGTLVGTWVGAAVAEGSSVGVSVGGTGVLAAGDAV